MIKFAGLILFTVVVTGGLATVVLHWRPNWSVRRTACVAAAPMPIVLAGFCIWLFVDAAMSWKKACGVDACGMAMMFAVIGLGYAFVSFVLGLISAAFVKRAGGPA